MNDAKMTIRLPISELEFAKAYARRSGFSLTALVGRYLARLQSSTEGDMPAEIKAISGIVPSKVDARAEYHAHHMKKS
ncbi:MAG: DUF6364 family protein [bacterium]